MQASVRRVGQADGSPVQPVAIPPNPFNELEAEDIWYVMPEEAGLRPTKERLVTVGLTTVFEFSAQARPLSGGVQGKS